MMCRFQVVLLVALSVLVNFMKIMMKSIKRKQSLQLFCLLLCCAQTEGGNLIFVSFFRLLHFVLCRLHS